MGLNSNVSKVQCTCNIILKEHLSNQLDTMLGTKCLNNVSKIKLIFVSL